jgi:hypothetical protein
MAEDMDMGAPPPEESGNRMFLIGAIILGGIFVFALIAIFALYFLTRPGATPAALQPQDMTATAAVQAGFTQTAAAQGTQTRVAVALQTAAITYTPSQTVTASKSPTRTSTPVVFATISNATNTPIETPKPSATETQVGATAVRTGTPTALPQTGFGDSAGFPGLIFVGGAAIVLIIVARQLRLGRVRR